MKEPGSCVSSLAVTAKRARCVHTFASMLAGRPHSPALVNVLVACGAGEAGGAGADRLAGDLVCVTAGAHVAWHPCTFVFQVAEETSLAWWAFTLVTANLVMTSATILARTIDTLVRVKFAVYSFKSVDTDALIATLSVLAGAVVLAGLGHQALVHVLAAVVAGPCGGARARVGVHAVHAPAAVLAEVARAVVPVSLAVAALEPWGERCRRWLVGRCRTG